MQTLSGSVVLVEWVWAHLGADLFISSAAPPEAADFVSDGARGPALPEERGIFH